jgi:hypothetical protein
VRILRRLKPTGESQVAQNEKKRMQLASYSLCRRSLDQNSPAPRTRATSHQEKTPTQQLIMNVAQCGGNRVALAASINGFSFFKSLLPVLASVSSILHGSKIRVNHFKYEIQSRDTFAYLTKLN